MTRKQKQIGLLLLGIALALLGIACLCQGLLPKTRQKEQILLDYEIQARMPYRVKLLPNKLYGEQWKEEGGVYSWKLTDYIEVAPSVEIVCHRGQPEAGQAQENPSVKILGDCQVTAVVEGYQTSGESRKIVYEQRTLLRERKTDLESGKMEMTIPIRPNVYTVQAERAEQILGTSVPKECYLLFEGDYEVQAGEMKEEKAFSLRLGIPMGNGQGLYELTPGEFTPVEGKLVKVETERVPIAVGTVLAGGALLILGGIIGFAAWFCVEPADEKELWREHMRKILRQYGSRMVCVKELPKGEEWTCVRDMDGLALVAEEIQSPILFSLDQEELPVDGRFVVVGETGGYQVHFPKPNTTLVVEKSGPKADSLLKESDYTENASNKSSKEEDSI